MRVALTILALLATLMISPTASAVSAPVLSVGDFWELESKFAIPGSGEQTLTIKNTIEDQESISVEGATHDAWRMVGSYAMTFGAEGYTSTSTTETKSWSRVSDGASLKSTTHTETTSNIPGFPASSSDSETVYTPPCVAYQWPLDVGDSWTATCTYETTTTTAAGTQTTTNTTTTDYSVLRKESVTVPAGTFDAYVLESTMKTDSGETKVYSWYAAAACGPVKTSLSIDGNDYSSQLKSYKCAKAGQTQSGGTGTTTTTTTSTPPTASTTGTTTTTPTPTPTGVTEATPGIPGVALPILLVGLAGAALMTRRRA